MAWAPLAMMAVATAVQVASASSQAAAAEEQANYEKEMMRRREEEAHTAALQAEAERRRELNATLNTISAVRAGRGLSDTSMGATVLRDAVSDDQMRDLRNERLSLLSGADAARAAGVQAGNRASAARTAGNFAIAGSLLNFGTKVAGGLGGGGGAGPIGAGTNGGWYGGNANSADWR